MCQSVQMCYDSCVNGCIMTKLVMFWECRVGWLCSMSTALYSAVAQVHSGINSHNTNAVSDWLVVSVRAL